MQQYKLTTHEKINDTVKELVEANMNFHGEHNRESLDDLIADLTQYRDSLPTCEEYMEANEL